MIGRIKNCLYKALRRQCEFSRTAVGLNDRNQKERYMMNQNTCPLGKISERQLLPTRFIVSCTASTMSSADKRSKDLLQCLKITVLTFSILILLCIEAKAEQTLSENEIKTQIIGHSFKGKKGFMSVLLDYATDGTVTMRLPIGTGKGSWVLSGDQLCVTLLSGPRKGKECLTFIRQSDGTFRGSNGIRLTLVE